MYQGKYIKITEEEIHGHTYERTSLLPNVHVLPIRDNKILLMNEYRTHEKSSRWKLISGWCDKENKKPLDHAQEELAEEVGMQAEYWEEFFDGSSENATVNYNTHYFVCKNISELPEKIESPDSGEVLDYDWFRLDQIFDMINQGKIWPGASTMVAVWYLYNAQR